ncbi:MAG: transcription termination factor Rho [Alphaproteobacteria bacterium]|nr:transcription termination factor Rho [Alphaproteobacteria bacterium]
MHLREIKAKSPVELLRLAETLGLDGAMDMKRRDLTFSILQKKSEQNIAITTEGVLEILPDGFGFLRSAASNYLAASDDVYVTVQQIKSLHLKKGDVLEGVIKSPKEGERYFSFTKITKVNFADPHMLRNRIPFDQLTPLFPTRKITLESPDGVDPKNKDLTLRVTDLIAPIGFGQRGLIVAPPRTGKTVILQTLIKSIMHHHPEVQLIVLLIDERPEEVTEMARTVKNGEVISSTFDEPAARHVQVAEMVIEKAKRLVEAKKDVVIFLDSITRLARAYNTVVPSSGKVLTGGVDASALQKPKRLFGAARNVEEGGSLTIIGTALVDTGSRMDEVVFEEFKGTGNSELILDRKLADKRTFPAIDITRSGTRREELLVDPAKLQRKWLLRRALSPMSAAEATDFLLERLKMTKNNDDFLDSINRPST